MKFAEMRNKKSQFLWIHFYRKNFHLQKENFITFGFASGESGSVFMKEQF